MYEKQMIADAGYSALDDSLVLLLPDKLQVVTWTTQIIRHMNSAVYIF